ncbi:HAD family hydrolase [Halomarina litorea]|uniref:HAD family hydrolase n=1 Tax=Halomarina litorea TaxID=2961595 RepID=UPI0020C3D1E3|nr:HAD family hydrolase [Halomarina sp. BCD28]
MAVSFDLFGTLVSVRTPEDPARAVARELASRGVAVPDDWATAYRERHVEAPQGAEVPLPAHVARALASREVDAPGNAPRRAVVAAFDPEVTTRPGAPEAVAAAADVGPVALCSNCSVPELAARTLIRSEVDRSLFDATVTSVACGWRKPSEQMFERVADALGVPPAPLVHVGDDPRTDGGIEAVGGRFVDVSTVSLADFPDWLARENAEDPA